MCDTRSNEKSFAIDARTIFQLGKEAIENELLAVSELVKNAYDADATSCVVDFIMERNENDNCETKTIAKTIVIQDNGFGMSEDDFLKNWLRIGTSNKKDDPFTPKGRRKIGEKGIGRLALNRLGDRVRVISHKANYEPVLLSIDFRFFAQGEDLVNIPVSIEVNPLSISVDFIGTRIEVADLTDEWDETKIELLERKMFTLQNPLSNIGLDSKNTVISDFSVKTNTDIDIEVLINSGRYDSNNIELKGILDNSLFRASIDVDTRSNTWCYRYSFHPYDKMSRLSYSLKQSKGFELINYKEEAKTIRLSPDDLKIGKFNIVLFGFDFSALVNRLSPITSIAATKKVVKEVGGVKVYRDNHRVYNYGEPGNDWLDLDVKRVNKPGRTLGNSVLIGAVSLNRNDSQALEEKTNREGFIDNAEYRRFRSIVQAAVLDFSFEVEIYKSRIKKFYGEANKRIKSDEIYEDLMASIDLAVDDEKAKDDIKGYVVLYKKQMDYLKEVLFNVSINTMDYINIFHDLEEKMHQIQLNVSKAISDSSLNNQIDETILFVQTHNQLIRDRDKKTYNLNTLLHNYLHEQKYYFARNDLETMIDFSATKDMTFVLHQPSIKRVLNNIISNSVYWTSANERKVVSIKTGIENDMLTITVDDNGPGFDGDIDFLREPFVTRKKGNQGLGLGLFIIDELMQKQNGYADYSNDSEVEDGGARVKLVYSFKSKENI